MDPTPINPQPLIVSPHSGNETLEQRPTDDHFPVGVTCLDQQPPSNLYHSVNPLQPQLIAFSNGAPVFPTQSAGLGHFGQQSPSASYHPGGFVFAGQQLPSIDEILLYCSMLINQLMEQQQHLQALCATHRKAMAAQPSSISSQPKQHLEVRTSMRLDQEPSSPTIPYEAHLDVPLMALSSTRGAHCVHQEGGRTSLIQKGRKCNKDIRTIRHPGEAGPVESQDWPADSVESGTSIVNGKLSGSQSSPASVSAHTGESQRLPGESIRDVIIDSAHPNIVLATKGLAQRPCSEDMEVEGHYYIAGFQRRQRSSTTRSRCYPLFRWIIQSAHHLP